MDEFIDLMIIEDVDEGTLMCRREKTWRDYARLIVRGKWRAAWRLRGCDGVAEAASPAQERIVDHPQSPCSLTPVTCAPDPRPLDKSFRAYVRLILRGQFRAAWKLRKDDGVLLRWKINPDAFISGIAFRQARYGSWVEPSEGYDPDDHSFDAENYLTQANHLLKDDDGGEQ